MKRTAALWVRVSTSDQATEMQTMLLENGAEKRNPEVTKT